MKTLSDSDWHEAEKIIRKYMETTLSRSELKQCVDLLAKIEADAQRRAYTNMLDRISGVCVLD